MMRVKKILRKSFSSALRDARPNGRAPQGERYLKAPGLHEEVRSTVSNGPGAIPMMKGNPASALLIVLAGTTGLLALLFTCWQLGSWTDDLVSERELYIKRFYATEMVLNYGLTQVRQQFDILRSQVEEREAPVRLLGSRQTVNGRPYEVLVTVDGVAVVGQTLFVRAAMFEGEREVCCLLCLLEKFQPKTKQEEPTFVVHHFRSTAST